MILTYAKITHFYTLILGFSLFIIASLLATYGLIFARRRPYGFIAAACIVTLLNPATHYLILFALYLSITVASLVLLEALAFLRSGGLRRLRAWPAHKAALRGFWATLRPPHPVGLPGRIRFLIGRGLALWSRLSQTTLVRCILAFVLLAVLTVKRT